MVSTCSYSNQGKKVSFQLIPEVLKPKKDIVIPVRLRGSFKSPDFTVLELMDKMVLAPPQEVKVISYKVYEDEAEVEVQLRLTGYDIHSVILSAQFVDNHVLVIKGLQKSNGMLAFERKFKLLSERCLIDQTVSRLTKEKDGTLVLTITTPKVIWKYNDKKAIHNDVKVVPISMAAAM